MDPDVVASETTVERILRMRKLLAWSVLIAVFLAAGEGLNLFRIYLFEWFRTGRLTDALMTLLGLVIAFLCTAFLGGFVYYRDQKRGKIKREGWRGRPVRRQPGEPRTR
jgi:ABC-type Fe3+-siderophore transport system permease subunit